MIVLGTVSLQFQGQFVPTSLMSVLRIVAPMPWLQSGHHVVNFFHLVGGFSIYKTAQKIWLRILSIALEEKLQVLDFA